MKKIGYKFIVIVGTVLLFASCSCKILNAPCNEQLFVEVRKSDTSCQKRDGDIIVQVSGGDKPYKFSWKHDSNEESNQVSELGQGLYQVIITDASGRETVSQIIIN